MVLRFASLICDVGAHISQNFHCLKHCFGISYVFCVEESTFNIYMIEIKGQRNIYMHLYVFYIWDIVIYGAIVSRVPFPSFCLWGKQGKHNPRPHTSLRQRAKLRILLCVENAVINDNRKDIKSYKEVQV